MHSTFCFTKLKNRKKLWFVRFVVKIYTSQYMVKINSFTMSHGGLCTPLSDQTHCSTPVIEAVTLKPAGGLLELTGHFGTKTFQHQDSSAPVQNGAKVSRDNSAPVFYSAPVLKYFETLRHHSSELHMGSDGTIYHILSNIVMWRSYRGISLSR